MRAAGDVDEQRDLQGHLFGIAQFGDLLLFAFLFETEVSLGESFHRLPVTIRH